MIMYCRDDLKTVKTHLLDDLRRRQLYEMKLVFMIFDGNVARDIS